MNYRKMFILVEGQTEESFVKNVLQKSMPQGLCLNPVIVTTKRDNSGGKSKGGASSYEKVKKDVKFLLKDSNAIMVTTMIDYYGSLKNFPSREKPKGTTALARVTFVEDAFTKEINHPRFKAYLSLHEFEALLFTDPQAIANHTEHKLLPNLQFIRNSFATPEDINDSIITAPSKRLEALFPSFSKPLLGTRICQEIGLQKISAQCPHFAKWVQFLQSL